MLFFRKAISPNGCSKRGRLRDVEGVGHVAPIRPILPKIMDRLPASVSRGRQMLYRLMKQVGAIGCLVDSLIDLSADRRLGVLEFKPGISDYAKLIVSIVRDGLTVSLKHPRLNGLFLRALADNVGDRFRAGSNPATPSFVSDRKAGPASVA